MVTKAEVFLECGSQETDKSIIGHFSFNEFSLLKFQPKNSDKVGPFIVLSTISIQMKHIYGQQDTFYVQTGQKLFWRKGITCNTFSY